MISVVMDSEGGACLSFMAAPPYPLRLGLVKQLKAVPLSSPLQRPHPMQRVTSLGTNYSSSSRYAALATPPSSVHTTGRLGPICTPGWCHALGRLLPSRLAVRVNSHGAAQPWASPQLCL